MRIIMSASVMAVFLAALALATGCEETPLSAGKDYKMTLLANPSAVVVDPGTGDGTVSSTIVATVLSDTGTPQKGFTVFFSADGGTLASGTQGVKTDGNGAAYDTLTVRTQDPATITITALSSTLTQTVKVTKSNLGENRPPVAKIVVDPIYEAAVRQLVVFDGRTSSDPDSADSVSVYSWSISSSTPDADWTPNPRPFTGSTVRFETGFVGAQTLDVTLTVTDEHSSPSTPARMTYYIKSARLCSDNTVPTAVIAGSATQTKSGAVAAIVRFTLDGTLSSDVESPIQTYTWNCGGSPPVGTGSSVGCDYTVASTSQTYDATLVVKDQGFGLPSLECQQTSAAATVHLVVSPQ